MIKITSNISTTQNKSKEISLFSFKKLSETFLWSLKWNGFESLIYHSIFIAHTWYMYKVCDKTLYGLMGTLFALAYLMVTCLMMGLDNALTPWIVAFTQNKISYRKLIQKYLLPQCMIFCTAPLILHGLWYIPYVANTYADLRIYATLLGIFISVEGIKKLLRHVLQLCFMNKLTAFLEIGGIALFSGMVWIMWLSGIPFSMNTIIIPFIISSSIIIAYSIKSLYTIYQKLPHQRTLEKLPSHAQVATMQLSSSINQMTRSLFSTNILIPLSASITGFLSVSTLVFYNYVSHACTFFIYKICAPSAAAFFGRTIYCSHNDQKKSLTLVMKIIGIILLIALFIIIASLWYTSAYETIDSVLILGLLLVLHIMENIFIMYEKFLLAQKKMNILTYSNLLQCCIFLFFIYQKIIVFHNLPILGIMKTLIICMSIRLCMFLGISYYIFMVKK